MDEDTRRRLLRIETRLCKLMTHLGSDPRIELPPTEPTPEHLPARVARTETRLCRLMTHLGATAYVPAHKE